MSGAGVVCAEHVNAGFWMVICNGINVTPGVALALGYDWTFGSVFTNGYNAKKLADEYNRREGGESHKDAYVRVWSDMCAKEAQDNIKLVDQ